MIGNSAVRGKTFFPWSGGSHDAGKRLFEGTWAFLQGVLKLRVSGKSDSRTVNLVNFCANLFHTCGDQGSISIGVGFCIVSTINSTRSTLNVLCATCRQTKVRASSHLTLLMKIVRSRICCFRLAGTFIARMQSVHVCNVQVEYSQKVNKAGILRTPSTGSTDQWPLVSSSYHIILLVLLFYFILPQNAQGLS